MANIYLKQYQINTFILKKEKIVEWGSNCPHVLLPYRHLICIKDHFLIFQPRRVVRVRVQLIQLSDWVRVNSDQHIRSMGSATERSSFLR